MTGGIVRPIAAAAWMLALCGCGGDRATTPAGSATVAGTVLDAVTRLGLSDATVEAVDGPNAGRSARTAGDGRFVLEGLASGSFAVRATHAAGEPETAAVTVLEGARADVRLAVRPRPCDSASCGAASRCNHVLSFFARPFEGDFRVSNHFDHAYPQSFSDAEPDIKSYCGARGSYNGHEGYDWVMPVGTRLNAVAPGTVTFAGTSATFFCPLLERDTANTVIEIEHAGPTGERFRVRYLHVSAMAVQAGQSVAAGETIGASGTVGCSTGPHLHFDVRRQFGVSEGRTFVFMDPFGWQGSGPDPWSRHPAGAFSPWIWANAPSIRGEHTGPAILEFHPAEGRRPGFR